jgi:hypothetical protein
MGRDRAVQTTAIATAHDRILDQGKRLSEKTGELIAMYLKEWSRRADLNR